MQIIYIFHILFMYSIQAFLRGKKLFGKIYFSQNFGKIQNYRKELCAFRSCNFAHIRNLGPYEILQNTYVLFPKSDVQAKKNK